MDRPLRVMWLLNHTSARKFEVPMLKAVGVHSVFTPKSFPQSPNFRSASVTFADDNALDIPSEELEVLNAQDWYGVPSATAWSIANKYFDVVFFIMFDADATISIFKNFHGAIVWRAYGLVDGLTHTRIMGHELPNEGIANVKRLGTRFWFGSAYKHLHEVEAGWLSRKNLFLPLGLPDASQHDEWIGGDERVYFVCPDIETNSYYGKVYEKFSTDFKDLPYAVGGAQSIPHTSNKVLGYLPYEEHHRNMQQMRVMFYHSTEPNHIHYHPFEAVRAGMPLIFMAGGLLDSLGGQSLPGRCLTIAEARIKLKKVLAGDRKFIEKLRSTQICLLDPMRAENCRAAWELGFKRIVSELSLHRAQRPIVAEPPKRIAVIVPVGYRGGSLRGAKLLAEAILIGSKKANEPISVVFCHLDDEESYGPEEFRDLPLEIKVRPYEWQVLDATGAVRSMRYAGHEGWNAASDSYLVPDDGIKQLMDCDAWLVISDRVTAPILPLRPIIYMVYDYLQRYANIMSAGGDIPFLNAVRSARKVLVTTEFTKSDALQYAGLDERRLAKVPMLAPSFSSELVRDTENRQEYFLWTTNLSLHKNHLAAFKALRDYYELHQGALDCYISGVGTDKLFTTKSSHLAAVKKLVDGSEKLKRRVKLMGELSEDAYQSTLGNAAFLWHAGLIDNGTFSVIEAACLGVPALSSGYPAMREIDATFELGLAWMDSRSFEDMAKQLKIMELEFNERRRKLPSGDSLRAKDVSSMAGEYWGVIKECL